MPEYKQKSKEFVRDKIVERISEGVLKHQITDLLFERDYELLLEEIRQVKKQNLEKRIHNGTVGKQRRRRRV